MKSVHVGRFAAFWLSLLLVTSGCGSCDSPTPADGDLGAGDVGVVDEVGVPDASDPDMGVDPTPDMREPLPDLPSFDFSRPDAPGDMGPVVFRLDAVIPPRGPVDGGTAVVITGSGFSTETVVFFGSRQVDVELIDGDLVGTAPAAAGPGPVTVKVLDPAFAEEEVLPGGFEYFAPLAVDSVTPRRVPTDGGVELTVRGRGFNDDTRASFGGQTGLRHVVIDPTLMRVVAPPHPAGVVDVRVTNRDATATLAGGVEYFAPLDLDAVRPATGSTAGGETVTLTGSGFDSSLIVEFGGAPATVQTVAATGDSATVVTPAHPAGIVDVRLENGNGDGHIEANAFYYSTPGEFSVAAISPTQGVASGGTEVLLIGAGLDAASLTVAFDGLPATIVDKGPGHALVQTPAHAEGVVDVTASDGTTTDTLPDAFTYVADLWIDRVTPATGNVAGGDVVVIDGEGFTDATNVVFGGIAADFTIDSNTKITATTPPHSAGIVDVVVERDEVTARFRDAFTFTEPLEVYGQQPARGSIAGNTWVQVFGRGFVGTDDVTFDGISAADVDIIDAQTLGVRTPPHAPGQVDLTVTTPNDSATSPVPYTFYNPGSRFGGAWGGPVNGSVNVTVYSTEGQPLENAFVMLSTTPETPYQGYTDVNGMVTLSGPDVLGEQTVTATYQLFLEARPCNPEIKWTSSATVQRVDAENITIFLTLDPPPPMGPTTPPEAGCEEGTFECFCRLGNPPCDDPLQCNPFTGVCCPPPGEPPTQPGATFTGYLSGLDKIAEPGPTEFQMAIVYTTQRDPWSQNPDPGDGNVVLTNGTYTLNSRIGDLALIAVGGLYNNQTNTFKPLMMGVERYLFAADGQVYTVDLDLNIPLDTPLSFKVNHSPRYPNGPTMNEVVPWLDLGFEGVHGGVQVATGNGDIVTAANQAALTGIFSDAKYIAVGGAYNQGGLPLTIGIARGITDTSKVIDIPGLIGIAHVTSPQPGLRPVDGLIEFDLRDPAIEPDFYYLNISVPTLAGLKSLWEGFLPGNARSLRLPDFPEFSALPVTNQPSPYPQGSYLLDIIGVSKPGFQWESFSYNDLGFADWEGYSYSRTAIAF